MKLLLGDCLVRMKELEDNSIDAIVTDPPYGLSFMGKKWDYDVPSQEIWEECLRILKPGGYLLSFAGTRTQHRMAVRIEDAGFEIRDMIAWIYGSGFPKSLNIGKAVDKLQGNERELLETKYRGKNAGKQSGIMGKTVERIDKITKGTSEWEGWGTALKPALEPITVARKPLEEKTVAKNCLKWGVGGINIDGCRVGVADNEKVKQEGHTRKGNVVGDNRTSVAAGQFGDGAFVAGTDLTRGRFPANLIHDGSDEVVELFPNTKGGTAVRHNSGGKTFGGEIEKPPMEDLGYADSGSAARFFYCAKASKKERNMGCEGMEEKQVFGDEGGTYQGLSNSKNKSTNFHPTVKPIALMEYLVKLVSRDGATVLDPFMGSGTTGMACKKLDREFIGIEMSEDYMKIAKARIGAVKQDKQIKLIE